MKRHNQKPVGRLFGMVLVAVLWTSFLVVPVSYAQTGNTPELLSKIRSGREGGDKAGEQVIREVKQRLAHLNALSKLDKQDEDEIDAILVELDKANCVSSDEQDQVMTQAFLRSRVAELRRRRGVAVALLKYPEILQEAINEKSLAQNDLYEPLVQVIQEAKAIPEIRLLKTIKASEQASKNTKFLAELCLRKAQGDPLAEPKEKGSPQAFSRSYVDHVEANPTYTLDEVEFWANPLLDEHKVKWERSVAAMNENLEKATKELNQRRYLAETLKLALNSPEEAFKVQDHTTCQIRVQGRDPIIIHRTVFGQWRFHGGL